MPDTPPDLSAHLSQHGSVAEVFPAVAEEIGCARRSVSRWLQAMGVEDAIIWSVATAVSEACTNAVVHGYRDRAVPSFFEVAAHRSDLELFVRVSDNGCGTASRPDSPVLGRGLPLIEALTTRLDVRADDHGRGTVVTMIFDAVVPMDVDALVSSEAPEAADSEQSDADQASLDAAGAACAEIGPALAIDAAQASRRAGRVALSGDVLLAAVTDAMVALHLRYYHRVPSTAKTQLLGEDLIACTLGGIYTDVEKTMIELQNSDVVKSTRLAFQTAMRHKFIESVERLSGRDVTNFVSNLHVGPTWPSNCSCSNPRHSTLTQSAAEPPEHCPHGGDAQPVQRPGIDDGDRAGGRRTTRAALHRLGGARRDPARSSHRVRGSHAGGVTGGAQPTRQVQPSGHPLQYEPLLGPLPVRCAWTTSATTVPEVRPGYGHSGREASLSSRIPRKSA